MKKDTLKKLFVIVVLLLFYVVSIRAAYGDVITEQITIKLEKAGELGGKIDNSKLNYIHRRYYDGIKRIKNRKKFNGSICWRISSKK